MSRRQIRELPEDNGRRPRRDVMRVLGSVDVSSASWEEQARALPPTYPRPLRLRMAKWLAELTTRKGQQLMVMTVPPVAAEGRAGGWVLAVVLEVVGRRQEPQLGCWRCPTPWPRPGFYLGPDGFAGWNLAALKAPSKLRDQHHVALVCPACAAQLKARGKVLAAEEDDGETAG